MKCPTCKRVDSYKRSKGKHEHFGIELEAQGDLCTHCGEFLIHHAELGRLEREISRAIVARGIRTGREFQFVRKELGITAVDVAAMFDVRPETVSRWERGEIDLPRLAAFVLGELFEHPQVARRKLESLAG